jgi:hypothetical protein
VKEDETLTMKSFTISFSSNVNSSLGSTLAGLKTTQVISPNFSTSPRTFLYEAESMTSVLHVLTSTFLSVLEERKERTVSRSCSSRFLSRDIKATLLNFFKAKREAVETPIPGPEPMTTRVSDVEEAIEISGCGDEIWNEKGEEFYI